MRLPLARDRHAALVELLHEMERLGTTPVLVGGLVPPLLLEHLDPDGFASVEDSRQTSDCDLVLQLPIHDGAAIYEQVVGFLSMRWTRNPRENQFRWDHRSGLLLDLIPVPAGIERGERAAVALAERLSPDIDVHELHWAQEFAVASALDVTVLDPLDVPHRLRIASLLAMFAMKLRARHELRRRYRKSDAHDVTWLLRYLDTSIVVRTVVDAGVARRDLVDYVGAELRRDFADPYGEGITRYVKEAFPERYRNPDDDAEGERLIAASKVQAFLVALAM